MSSLLLFDYLALHSTASSLSVMPDLPTEFSKDTVHDIHKKPGKQLIILIIHMIVIMIVVIIVMITKVIIIVIVLVIIEVIIKIVILIETRTPTPPTCLPLEVGV